MNARLAAIAVAALVAAVMIALALTGCSAPCSGHGGAIGPPLGGWYYCHDGTREYG